MSEIDTTIEKIFNDKESSPDPSANSHEIPEGARLSPFDKHPSLNLRESVSQKVHEVQDDEALLIIQTLVKYWPLLTKSHKDTIKYVCQSSEFYFYKEPTLVAASPIEELIFDWVYNSLIPNYQSVAYDIIFTKNFDIESGQKGKYLEDIKSRLDDLLESFSNTLTEELNYYCLKNPTINDLIFRWISTDFIPYFLKEAREFLNTKEINVDDNTGKKFLHRIKTQKKQISNKFINSLDEEIKRSLPRNAQKEWSNNMLEENCCYITELIEGETYYIPVPNRAHQKTLNFLSTEIKTYIQSNNPTYEMYSFPFAVKLFEDNDLTVVQPDISVIHNPAKLTDEGCSGAPNWIIEIVSPKSISHDYIRKLYFYKEAGVNEYWIVNPDDNSVFVYYLNKDNPKFQIYTFKESIKVNIYPNFEIDFSKLDIKKN